MNEDKQKFLEALREFTNEVQQSDVNPIDKPILMIYQDGKIQAFRTGVQASTKDGGAGGGGGSFPP